VPKVLGGLGHLFRLWLLLCSLGQVRGIVFTAFPRSPNVMAGSRKLEPDSLLSKQGVPLAQRLKNDGSSSKPSTTPGIVYDILVLF
jgi:hypothetical protein